MKVRSTYAYVRTCSLSRAVHREVVMDLSTETFLQAFWRCVSCKLLPCLMISDNASMFESATEDLHEETIQFKGTDRNFE